MLPSSKMMYLEFLFRRMTCDKPKDYYLVTDINCTEKANEMKVRRPSYRVKNQDAYMTDTVIGIKISIKLTVK